MRPTQLYGVMSFLLGFGMFATATTYIPMVMSLGISLSGIAILNAGFFAMIVLAEIPTGMLADGKSRAWSIRMGILTAMAAMLTYACAVGFWTALFSEVLAGIAAAFLSGAQQAWLVDALERHGESDQLPRAFGTAAIMKTVGVVFGGAAGAGVGLVSLRLPFVLEFVVLAGTYAYVQRRLGDLGEPKHRVSETEALRQSAIALHRSPSLRWVACTGIVFGLVLPFNEYWAPYFRSTIGAKGIGALWIPMYVSLAIGGSMIRRLRARENPEAAWITIALAFSGLSLVFIGSSFATLSIGSLLVHEFSRGIFDPAVDVFTQRRVESQYRATYGSLQSFVGRFGYGGILVAVWAGTRHRPTNTDTIRWVWSISGTLLASLAILLWFLRPRSSKPALS